MLTIIFFVLLVIGYVYLFKHATEANTRAYTVTRFKNLQRRETGRKSVRGVRANTATSVKRASTALQTATLRTDRFSRAVVAATLGASVAIAAILGGPVAALLMVAAVATCAIVPLYYVYKNRRDVKQLLRTSRVAGDEPLYVPEDWQNR